MMDVMEDRDVWRLNLKLRCPTTLRKKRAMKKEDEIEICKTKAFQKYMIACARS